MTATARKTAPDMTAQSNPDGSISCLICNAHVHHIGKHLEASPHTISVGGEQRTIATEEEYAQAFPSAPLTSPSFQRAAEQHAAKRKAQQDEVRLQQIAAAKVLPFVRPGSTLKLPMYEVFGLELTEDVRTLPRQGKTEGEIIQIDVLTNHTDADLEAIPEVDDGYVFRVAELKDGLMSLALSDNTYVYGSHGTGKTTFAEQICARTKRPVIRVQHTDTTEESHIVGQMVVRNGATEFDYGPLAEAMLNGWVYLADEYDVAHPGVLAVYQPVLEGKDLYIKEAPPAMRRVKPHPSFRFFATGNTNGSGDDTGLYSGTKVGNAANYSRFGTTIRCDYPTEATERQMIVNRCGIKNDVAAKLVDFATRVRGMYEQGEISLPISPRELIGAAKKGVATGGRYRHGLDLNYINRLNKVEAEACRGIAQRVFG